MLNANNKRQQNDVNVAVLVSLLFSLNIFHIFSEYFYG